MIYFSIVVPTFNRPDEVVELLKSVEQQTYRDFEIIFVDGSPTDILHPVIQAFESKVSIQYFHEKKLKASPSRNYGVQKANGKYIVFVDSDCILPQQFLQQIYDFIQSHGGEIDAYGGPDEAHESFTTTQKAINYAMTSRLTTGGIRGKKKHIGQFQLRGFNMGMKKTVFDDLNGFSEMEVGEDIDLSMRLWGKGYTANLIDKAFVYHKRRVSLSKFRKQLFMHGKGRIDLYKRHSSALKLVHLIPSFFVLALVIGFVLALLNNTFLYLFTFGVSFHLLLLFLDAAILNRSIKVGIAGAVAAYVMLIAYGCGVMYNFTKRIIFGYDKESEKSIELKN
ncbi:MAG: glycosyltransferase [Chitinophagales bacterium]